MKAQLFLAEAPFSQVLDEGRHLPQDGFDGLGMGADGCDAEDEPVASVLEVHLGDGDGKAVPNAISNALPGAPFLLQRAAAREFDGEAQDSDHHVGAS